MAPRYETLGFAVCRSGIFQRFRQLPAAPRADLHGLIGLAHTTKSKGGAEQTDC